MESPQTRSALFCGLRKKPSELTSKNVDSIIQRADDYLQSLVDNKTFSGSVLLARDDQILLIKGYGCSEYKNEEKNTSQTIYRIGSVTKPFTSTIILKLYENKQLDLNQKIGFYYSDYPSGQEITIEHLLSHTSGIADYTEMETFDAKFGENLTIDQVIRVFKDEPLKFKPGSQFSYSNSNYILLGLIIEKVTGKSYELNLRELILEPCSMNDTVYECECDHLFKPKHNQRACGYTGSIDANGFQSCRYIDMSVAAAAGGIHSTIEDLYRFDRCLYGETLLRNRTKKLMFKRVREDYALGWEVYRMKHGRVKQQHTGQIFGFTSYLARFPKENACVIILSNLEDISMDDLSECLANILFQEKSSF